MQIVLQQVFPLGRFHATPWRVNPFDDPYGEWPPSPWRFVRAVVARWYQWAREGSVSRPAAELDTLVAALCASQYRFRLPPGARKGSPVRQYFPVEFGWNPKERKKPAIRTYGTSLAQDNYWCIPASGDGAVWWFLDGDRWTGPLLDVLDRCLERITYFGRAEAFTRIHRVLDAAPAPNCQLLEHRVAGAVPILVPNKEATLADVERVTDDPCNVNRSVPLGARLAYAVRPSRPIPSEKPSLARAMRATHLMQFAIGWNVAPEMRAVVRLTARLRGRVIQQLLRIKTGDSKATWSCVGASIRAAIAEMTGKDAKGKPLTGPHRHTEFLVWFEDGLPTRMLVYREGREFDEDERAAILRAASRELSWGVAGSKPDAWKVRLVPLDRAVPPPAGFDGVAARAWESVTPYVPPRHFLRNGKPRPRESVESQIRRELGLRGFSAVDDVEVKQVGDTRWVAVHIPRRASTERPTIGDRRGYMLRLLFAQPIGGPVRLGHSSSLGLGLFRPVFTL
jgi:CRISPR-associated protein Csb2